MVTSAVAAAAASSHNRPLQLGIAYTQHHRSVRQPNYVQIVIQSQMGIAGGGRGDRVYIKSGRLYVEDEHGR